MAGDEFQGQTCIHFKHHKSQPRVFNTEESIWTRKIKIKEKFIRIKCGRNNSKYVNYIKKKMSRKKKMSLRAPGSRGNKKVVNKSNSVFVISIHTRT